MIRFAAVKSSTENSLEELGARKGRKASYWSAAVPHGRNEKRKVWRRKEEADQRDSTRKHQGNFLTN